MSENVFTQEEQQRIKAAGKELVVKLGPPRAATELAVPTDGASHRRTVSS